MDGLTGAGWTGLHVVVGICVLAIVPLGLEVLGRGQRLVRLWPVAALPASVALALPRGDLAAVLTVPYLLATLAVPVVLRRDRLAAVAAACLPVAAVGLVAERSGIELLGFPLGVLGLTAAHFQVAGFGALLLLGLVPPVDDRTRVARGAAPLGVALVGLGFLLGRVPGGEWSGDVIELVGASVLAAGLWMALSTRTGRAARWLLALSVFTLGLALYYATASVWFWMLPQIPLDWMVLTHGVLNAGAVLTALLVAWVGREQAWSAHRWSHRIGSGADRFEAASELLLTWGMHRRAFARVDPATPPASVGLRMLSTLGVGRLRLPGPCEVIAVERGPGRSVMHYRALPGHTFEGDERFTILQDDAGDVWFEVAVRSRPARAVARLAGPVVPVAQRLFIARCAHVLRRADGADRRRPAWSGVSPG